MNIQPRGFFDCITVAKENLTIQMKGICDALMGEAKGRDATVDQRPIRRKCENLYDNRAISWGVKIDERNEMRIYKHHLIAQWALALICFPERFDLASPNEPCHLTCVIRIDHHIPVQRGIREVHVMRVFVYQTP